MGIILMLLSVYETFQKCKRKTSVFSMKNILFNQKNISELPQQPKSIQLDAGGSNLLFANNPKNLSDYISLSLCLLCSFSLSLSDRTLRLAFLYDIVSLIPGELWGGGSGPSAAIDRFNQRRSTHKRNIHTQDHSTLLTHDSRDNETMW